MGKNIVQTSSAMNNQIQEGTTITGDITSNGTIRVDGILKGNLNIEGKVVLGQKGQIEGDILCANCDIEGFVKGKLIIKELLSLRMTAKVFGEIKTVKLHIEPGAVFTGTCNMDSNIEKKIFQKEPLKK